MKKFQLKRDLVSELYCQSGFSQMDKIGDSGNIGIRGFTS